MSSINVTNAKKDLYNLVQRVNSTDEPVEITGKESNAILIGEEDWRSIQETLYLSSVPGMRESIIEGMKTKAEEVIKILKEEPFQDYPPYEKLIIVNIQQKQ